MTAGGAAGVSLITATIEAVVKIVWKIIEIVRLRSFFAWRQSPPAQSEDQPVLLNVFGSSERTQFGRRWRTGTKCVLLAYVAEYRN